MLEVLQDTPFAGIKTKFEDFIRSTVAELRGKEFNSELLFVRTREPLSRIFSEARSHESAKTWLDICMRRNVLAYMADCDFASAFALVDLAIVASRENFLDESSSLNLLEDICDCSDVGGCIEAFEFMESRVLELTRDLKAQKGKGLVLLRLCNEILRRFSKMEYSNLCGRILSLIACSFPLSERSGVNLKGSFNTDNATMYEGKDVQLVNLLEQVDPETFSLAELEKDPSKFYPVFWRLQDLFMTAPSQLNKENFPNFQKLLNYCLLVLEAVDKSEKEMSRSSADVAELEFVAKYLTDQNLFMLQLRNSTFRRTVFVQIMVILMYIRFQFMQESQQEFPSNEDKKWIANNIKRILSILETMGRGLSFNRTLKAILDRENNWWKKKDCKSFEKAPVEISPYVPSPSKPSPAKIQLGSRELARLWKQNESLAVGKDKNLVVPELETFLEPFKMQLEPDSGIEKEYLLSADNAFVWKAFRLASKQYLHVYQNIHNFDLKQLVREVEKVDVKEEDQPDKMDIDKSAEVEVNENEDEEMEEKPAEEEKSVEEENAGSEGR